MQLSFSGNSTTNNNRMDGYSYDAAGNLLVDNANNHYTYDAEGRIIKVMGAAGTSCYVYDAEGQRVRKGTGSTNGCADTSTGTSVDYLYDLAGHEITEVSSVGAWNRGEVYVGGKHLATYSGGTSGPMYFIHADWLGTERARTTAQGAVYETCTSLPFGDGLNCSGSDPSPMHFTGKQRDAESGLDDFGARYFSSSMGRWASPDWAAAAEAVPYANFSDPQSLNLYAYVHNNPVTNLDADGHWCLFGKLGTTCNETPPPQPAPKPPLIISKPIVVPRLPGHGSGVSASVGHGQVNVNVAGTQVNVSASGTLGNITASTTGDVSAVVNVPTVGASVDIAVNGPNKDQKVLAEVDAGTAHVGVGTQIVRNPDGSISHQGEVIHVGLSTPGSPVSATVPVHGTYTPSLLFGEVFGRALIVPM